MRLRTENILRIIWERLKMKEKKLKYKPKEKGGKFYWHGAWSRGQGAGGREPRAKSQELRP